MRWFLCALLLGGIAVAAGLAGVGRNVQAQPGQGLTGSKAQAQQGPAGKAANDITAAREQTMSTTNQTATATFGGGCFWCTEALFQMLPGVKSVVSGYAGGHTENPTYKTVCDGTTGHAEVIQVEYDPSVVSYDKLLATFWEAHDPTTLNRQGADEGTQYRSIILYETDAEKLAAEKSRAEAQKMFKDPIVTEIVPLKKFFKAEGYHQDYYRSNPNQGYCRAVIRPKVEKFEKKLKSSAK